MAINVNYFQISWRSATNDIIQSSIKLENKHRNAQIKPTYIPIFWSVSKYDFLCRKNFSYSWMVNWFDTDLEHYSDMWCWRIQKGWSRQTDIESLIQNKACKLPRPLLLYCAVCFPNAPDVCLPGRAFDLGRSISCPRFPTNMPHFPQSARS